MPANNLREFVELARNSKPPLFYASIGNGSNHHLAMELLKQHVGIDLTHVPYRGGGPAAVAVLAGEVSAMFGGGSVVPTIKSGKLRGLASTGSVRNPATPELPTIAELYPGYEALSWHGLFVPAGTPQPVIDLLRKEIAAVLAQPDFREKLANTGSGEPYVVRSRCIHGADQGRPREVRQADPRDRFESRLMMAGAIAPSTRRSIP